MSFPVSALLGRINEESIDKSKIFKQLRYEILNNALFYVVLIALVLSAIISCIFLGDSIAAIAIKMAFRAARFVLLCVSITFIVWLLVFFRHDCSLADYSRLSWDRIKVGTHNSKVIKVLYSAVIFAVILAPYLYWKMKIPQMNPFSWDETLAAWDSQLFFNRQPWEILQPIFEDRRILTRIIDSLYLLWVFMCFAFFCGLFLSGKSHIRSARRQYWLATILSWVIIGLFAATAMSSAGPVYFQYVTGDAQTFGPLLEYLRSFGSPDTHVYNAQGLHAVDAANHLWGVYRGAIDAPAGISAMPSMHNAQALLFSLVAFRIRLWFGLLMALYAVIILIGSVHLAWHYFVDGIVAFAMVVPIWYFSGWILDRDRQTAPA
ncbi:phosphatase PAP2 family protein [Hoeflea sp. TYP-13]|uniref:phosphatase PAP2 family protein n=1 Tax=Hoeflea sp. TYP-13 TaxID=3230023 RepID=UPI0034C5F1FE